MNGEERIILQLFVGGICGIIAAIVAANKGRNALGWFFGGFFLGVIGLIIVCCLSNLTQVQAERTQLELENRRMREMIRQEQVHGETYRRYTTARLDAHDSHLGIDTRSPLLPDSQAEMLPALPAGEAAEEAGWYYELFGQPTGPVDRRVIAGMLRSGEIKSDTLVWGPSLRQWTPAVQIDSLRAVVEA